VGHDFGRNDSQGSRGRSGIRAGKLWAYWLTPQCAKPRVVTGFISQCYKPNKYVVFIDASPPRRFESETKVLGADGLFTFVLDAAKLTPGSYYLRFGRSKRGAGGQRFTVSSDTTKVDLGEVGECDV
jgi:hypothetical protein